MKHCHIVAVPISPLYYCYCSCYIILVHYYVFIYFLLLSSTFGFSIFTLTTMSNSEPSSFYTDHTIVSSDIITKSQAKKQACAIVICLNIICLSQRIERIQKDEQYRNSMLHKAINFDIRKPQIYLQLYIKITHL